VHVPHTYDYAIVRVVPRVERGEYVNAGIILSCDVERFLGASIELDEPALLALDPTVDLDLIRRTLAAIPAVCAGGADAGAIGRLSARERFPLAGCREKHDGANLPGSHRSMFGFARRTRPSDGDNGEAPIGTVS